MPPGPRSRTFARLVLRPIQYANGDWHNSHSRNSGHRIAEFGILVAFTEILTSQGLSAHLAKVAEPIFAFGITGSVPASFEEGD